MVIYNLLRVIFDCIKEVERFHVCLIFLPLE